MTPAPGLVVIYRWRIATEHVEAFRTRWVLETHKLKRLGGMGSLLGQALDGTYYAIALWPDAATRDAAFANRETEPWPPAVSLETVLLDPMENLWS